MLILESIRIALISLGQHRLRSAMTLLSMAIGVFAIVGVSSAIEVLNRSLNEGLEAVGSDDFMIDRKDEQVGRFRRVQGAPILLREALSFRERMPSESTIGLKVWASSATISAQGIETDAEIVVYGVDPNYLLFDDRDLTSGRNIGMGDFESGERVAMVGPDVAERLSLSENSLGAEIRINRIRFRLIGITEAKGAVMGMRQDNMVLIPATTVLTTFPQASQNTVSILVRSSESEMDSQIGEAVGIMRGVRKLSVYEPDNFQIVTQRDIEETVGGFTQYIVFFGAFCGVIALLAAGIGIMNIMLVSVKERTREIGVRKAVGARSGVILVQFLVEALTICQLGAVVGVLLGLGAGAALSFALNAPFPAPSMSLVWSILLCSLIGVIFGAYPAWRAARLDPIESLRYE